ncbi:MAG: hypothetical protein HY869_09320 [Chloroflexi bacterium]|nr:hypothetical protein [Chloroflexota bacterium]
MVKKFYTEKDIEDLFASGVRSLQVDEDIQMTGMAYEKAQRLGLTLLTNAPDQPPSAPVRPYLSSAGSSSAPRPAAVMDKAPSLQADPLKDSVLAGRIRAAVNARLGDQIDAQLLDTIIRRVLTSTGLK